MGDYGFNFRGSAGYIADGANETYVLADPYPTTRNGITFGWGNANRTGADRTLANERRLAGINYNAAAQPDNFTVDLPSAGTYIIHLALGDAFGGGNASCTCAILDGGVSTGATINYAGNVGNIFTDAMGTPLTDLTWPTSEVGRSITFANAQMNLSMSSPGFWVIAHLRIISANRRFLLVRR